MLLLNTEREDNFPKRKLSISLRLDIKRPPQSGGLFNKNPW